MAINASATTRRGYRDIVRIMVRFRLPLALPARRMGGTFARSREKRSENDTHHNDRDGFREELYPSAAAKWTESALRLFRDAAPTANPVSRAAHLAIPGSMLRIAPE
jgi:hypothetical protein